MSLLPQGCLHAETFVGQYWEDQSAKIPHPIARFMESESASLFEFIRGELARKADICANALEEARKLSERGVYGPSLNQLVGRAFELLDDIDEILVALDSTRDQHPFAIAAELHRQLEHVEAAIAAQKRTG
jgi:hypothetical protein